MLPFAFHKISPDKYIATNIVGEYLTVSRDTLKLLVNGTLLPSHPIYNDAKSKHFIMDRDSDTALDLLALKYRTKQHPISEFTGLHIFVVSLRCDYTCKYCQVSRKMEDVDKFDMSEETARKAVALAFESPSKSIKIEFQGGEPLLNFPIIKFIVSESLTLNIKENRVLQFVITSNLTFLSEEVLAFCKLHNIYISTSLDGPESIHNKNRPRPNKDGYQKTIDGIRAVQSELGKDRIAALMTTTSESLSNLEGIVDEYVQNDLHAIFLRPLSPYGFAIKTKQVEKYNVDKWSNFFKQGLEYIIKLNRAGYFLREQYTSIILTKILTPTDPKYVDLQSPSGIGISAVVYNYDGDVYASDEARMLKEMGDEKFKLGNVHTDDYIELFSSDILLDTLEESIAESAPMCSDCGLITYCGSDPVYHYATQGDVVGKKPLSFYCKKNTSIIEHIFELLEDPGSRKVLESWVL
ncbi:MAG: His-Xaa-Ser system radical SAM maturase HxsB [Alphaproteobacteria bacterium]|nr:MAG: His-Xaa-Ser system radical SAM maturase HxsB [Alphaproteobacteria bacterium]